LSNDYPAFCKLHKTVNELRKLEPCENCISTLLKFSESEISHDDPGVILKELADLLIESGLADKCVVMAEDSLEPGSRTVASCGFASEELKAAIKYIGDQAQDLDEALSVNKTPVVVMPNRLGMNALLSCTQDRNRNSFRFLVLSIRSDKAFQFTEADASYMGVLVNTLRLLLDRTDFMQAEPSCNAWMVERGEHWESGVDNMLELVCLLDDKGRVVRANKALEKWRLGDVKTIKGSSVHEMLHPDCKNMRCDLNLAWEELWSRSGHSGHETCELYDGDHDQDLRLRIRRGEGGEGPQLATLVIENISESKWETQLLEVYTEELYRKVQDQSLQLNNANAAFQEEVRNHGNVRKSLQKSQEQLETLSAKLLCAHEDERKRIAGELHDGIGQGISAIKLYLETLMAAGTSGAGVVCDKHQLGIIIGRLQAEVEEVRRISMGLRPLMLDDLGLLPTLQWFCREFKVTSGGLALKTVFDFDEQEMSSVQKLMIFRIVQEALNNVAKHSQADTVIVDLKSENDLLILLIDDNGTGFSINNKQVGVGFGLGSMKERARMSGGVLAIDSTIGKGTTIRGVWTQP
jgi:signal transduction histidine kinase